MRKVLALWIAMALTLTGLVPTVYAVEENRERQQEVTECYIVSLDEKLVLPAWVEGAFLSGQYDRVSTAKNEAIERFLQEVPLFRGKQIRQRFTLLITAFTAALTEREAQEVRALATVRSVEADRLRVSDEIPKSSRMFGSLNQVGYTESWRTKYSGKGQVGAVIDHDFDPSHPALADSDTVEEVLTPQIVREALSEFGITGGNYYYSRKVPLGINMENPEYSINPESHYHGEHVAGIMGGNRVDFPGVGTWQGVAPDAQLLLLYRRDDAVGVSIVRGLEMAVRLGAISANMSYGAEKESNTYFQAVTDAIAASEKAGLLSVVSTGNSGAYKGDFYVAAPDYGTIGCPGGSPHALTVGSICNETVMKKGIYLQGTRYPVRKATNYTLPDAPFSMILDRRIQEDTPLSGKIVVFYRGDITDRKLEDYRGRGAVGFVFYNSVGGEYNKFYYSSYYDYPIVVMNQGDGEHMAEVLDALGGEAESSYDDKDLPARSLDAGKISPNNDQGLTPDGFLKPDMLAPGDDIYSSIIEEPKWKSVSGSSMATPHVAGAALLLGERLDREAIFHHPKGKERVDLIRALLMNAAATHLDAETGAFSSPRRQGAGVLDIAKSLSLTWTCVDASTDRPSKYFGDITGDTLTFNLRFRNYGDSPIVLSGECTALSEQVEDRVLQHRDIELFRHRADKFEVPAGGEVVQTFQVPLQKMEYFEQFPNGGFLEGFWHFTDEGGMKISVPWAGFYGRPYADLPCLEAPASTFSFSPDHPMFWKYKFWDTPWYRYVTGLVIENREEDPQTGYSKEVPAGLKNVEEVMTPNGICTTEVRPVYREAMYAEGPLKFYVNPVRDGFNLQVKILDEHRETVWSDSFLGHSYNASTYYPEEDDTYYKDRFNPMREWIVYGYLLEDLPEGRYTVRWSAKNIDDRKTEVEVPLIIDRTAPEILSRRVSAGTEKIVVQDQNWIKDAWAVCDGKRIPLKEEQEGTFAFALPTGVSEDDVVIFVRDGAYNPAQMRLSDIPLSKDPMDRKRLASLVEEAPDVRKSDAYVFGDEALQKAYDAAIDRGKSVLENLDATQDEIDQAVSDIEAARSKLNGKRPGPVPTPSEPDQMILPTPGMDPRPFGGRPAQPSKPEEKPDEKPDAKPEISPEPAPVLKQKLVKFQLGLSQYIVTRGDHAQIVPLDVAPFAQSGRVFVPVRYVAESLGFRAEWIQETRTVVLTREDRKPLRIEIPLDRKEILVDGVSHPSDVLPLVLHERVYLPIGNIARAMGLVEGQSLLWNGDEKTVTILWQD